MILPIPASERCVLNWFVKTWRFATSIVNHFFFAESHLQFFRFRKFRLSQPYTLNACYNSRLSITFCSNICENAVYYMWKCFQIDIFIEKFNCRWAYFEEDFWQWMRMLACCSFPNVFESIGPNLECKITHFLGGENVMWLNQQFWRENTGTWLDSLM